MKMKSCQIKWTQKKLEVELSQLQGFEKANVRLEQYATPAPIAADWLWKAAFKRDIAGKVSVDAACGPGILGCGALLSGAKMVFFVDKSEEALALAKKNVEKLEKEYNIGKSEFSCCDIAEFKGKADTVLQNPPFGTKIKHHDKVFLETAFKVGNVVYSIHKDVTRTFVEAMARDNLFKITNVWHYDFGLPRTLPWHRRKNYVVKVGLWRMEKLNEAP